MPERFVPVAIAPVVPQVVDERAVEFELHRSGITVKLSWPVSAGQGSVRLDARVAQVIRTRKCPGAHRPLQPAQQ